MFPILKSIVSITPETEDIVCNNPQKVPNNPKKTNINLALKKAAKLILEMGPKYLIIKKGEHGALLFGEDKMFYAPALPLEEVF